ncbi:MAG: hypothetical protein WCW87_03000 [Candidatus Paceibacterota bacterium]
MFDPITFNSPLRSFLLKSKEALDLKEQISVVRDAIVFTKQHFKGYLRFYSIRNILFQLNNLPFLYINDNDTQFYRVKTELRQADIGEISYDTLCLFLTINDDSKVSEKIKCDGIISLQNEGLLSHFILLTDDGRLIYWRARFKFVPRDDLRVRECKEAVSEIFQKPANFTPNECVEIIFNTLYCPEERRDRRCKWSYFHHHIELANEFGVIDDFALWELFNKNQFIAFDIVSKLDIYLLKAEHRKIR